jgi:glycine betaine transporter
MIAKNILVPVDFSPLSAKALTYAVQLANALGARLYLLHVPGETGENLEANFPVGEFAIEARGPFGEFLPAQDAVSQGVGYASWIGTPAGEVVRFADARDVDLIVMGTHGRSGLAHALMGSVAERVVRTAFCPVLLIRQPGEAVATSAVRAVAATLRAAGAGGVTMV